MAHDRRSAANMSADITTNGTPNDARDHAFGEVGNTDRDTPPQAEVLNRVQRARVARTGDAQVDPAGCGPASGQIRAWDAPDQVANAGRQPHRP